MASGQLQHMQIRQAQTSDLFPCRHSEEGYEESNWISMGEHTHPFADEDDAAPYVLCLIGNRCLQFMVNYCFPWQP